MPLGSQDLGCGPEYQGTRADDPNQGNLEGLSISLVA